MATDPDAPVGSAPNRAARPWPGEDGWTEPARGASNDPWPRHGPRVGSGTAAPGPPAPDGRVPGPMRAHGAAGEEGWGGPSYRHRGARIECRPDGRVCRLRMAGHPLDGHGLGPAGAVVALIDLWLDGGRPRDWWLDGDRSRRDQLGPEQARDLGA